MLQGDIRVSSGLPSQGITQFARLFTDMQFLLKRLENEVPNLSEVHFYYLPSSNNSYIPQRMNDKRKPP